LIAEKHKPNGVVEANFDHFYTAHYNEILLYKHLDEMLYLAKCYGLRTMILSNGVNLTEEKVEILKRHEGVISGINLNIPAFEDGLWQERSGVTRYDFDHVRQNVLRTMKAFPEYTSNGAFSIGVNIPTAPHMDENGGWMEMLDNAPKINLDPVNGESAKQVALGKSLFPGLSVYPVESLIDRASILAEHKVINNAKAITRFRGTRDKVVGCSNGKIGRIYGWLHVNALGEAFLCCNDYDFDYTFGNINDNTLDEIWRSDAHAEMIERALGSICVSCASAIWK
jgi:MoaA/NifB/PqqE/SkfB family radical SAM enzyme